MRFEQCANLWNGEWDGHTDLNLGCLMRKLWSAVFRY